MGLIFLAALPSMTVLGAGPAKEALVDTAGLQRKPITRGTHKGKERIEQSFRFVLGGRDYRIRYVATRDPARPDEVFPIEGYIGMPSPCSCNWYHSGFLFVRINGRDVGRERLHSAAVAETGSRAIADLVWDARAARVRVRFAGLPADDKLFCEIALEPKGAIRDLRIGLRCYPSFFTAWHKRDGDRKIHTPAADLTQGQRLELPGKQNWYAVYYDTVFDVARGEGIGPCAMLFSPEAVEKVKFGVGSYGVDTELVCRPDAPRVRLVLWEFPKVSNRDALSAFRRQASKWAEELRALDFTPSAVRSFDPKAALAELASLTRSPEVRQQLGAKADSFRKRLRSVQPAGRGGLNILQEAALVALLPAYREFLWELKLAALLAD